MSTELLLVSHLTSLKESGTTQLLVWIRGGVPVDGWLRIPVRKSVGGGAGIFAAPTLIDPVSFSPHAQGLSIDLAGQNSRTKTGIVMIEVASEDWKDLYGRTEFRRGAEESVTLTSKGFMSGDTPASAR